MEIVQIEVSAKGTRGRSTFIYLPRIPSEELEKELSMLLGKG
jgi:hypothetical protein